MAYNKINVGGRLHSIATSNVLAGANEILDDSKGKKQSEINVDIDNALANRYTKDETYNKNELNSLITTPDVQYISVVATEQTAVVTDILPSVGAANTIYRVGKWDGTQYNTTVYSEYAWNGSAYVLLDVKEYGIDDEPTAGSDNPVKSGGVFEKLTEFNDEVKNDEKVIAAALVEFASYFDDGYRFKGLITDSVEENAAEEQIQKVAYLGFPGTYKNIGNNTFIVPEEHVGLFTYNGSNWNLRTIKYQPEVYKKITDFSDWTVGFIDSNGRIYDATNFVYKFLKVLAGQTLTVESYHTYTAIRKIDGTPISSGAVNTPKNIFTYTPEKTEHVYVCVYTGTSFGDKTPPVVTLSNVGTKWLSKENIAEFDGSNVEIEIEEEYSFISAKSLKQKNVTTETDGLWLGGSIVSGKNFDNTALGSIYKFKNDNYSYLYANIPSLRTENYRYWYAVSFFSDEEVSENTFIDGVTYENVDNHFVKMSIPDGCQYIYVSAGTANGVSNRNSVVRLYRDSSFLSFGELLDNFQIQKDTTIFDGVNDLPSIYDKYGQYIDIRNNFAYPGASTTPKTNFRFIFCSDVHKNEDAFKRIVNLTNRWAEDGCVDALINTGDVVYDRPNESFDWYNALRLQSKVDVLTTVGNHDWDYYIGGDKERTYNNIIAPMIGKVENIIQPSDGAEAYRFYYYKDYGTIRFIALYVRVDAADQLTWLEEVLEDARTNEKHVIIANHEPFNTNLAHLKFSSPEEFYNKVPNTFFSSFGSIQSPSYVESGGTIPASYCLAVKNFMDAGGIFVCWLSGHIHIDHFYYIEDTDTYGHQLMLNTAAVRQDKLTGEYVRKGSIGNRDLYNFVSVSTDQMMLKVLRIGANTDYIGRSKIVFTYHYGIHKMIANY